MSSLQLKIIFSDGTEQSVDLSLKSTYKIGSLPSNQIVAKGVGIEPIHALLEHQEDDSWIISDLGAKSGVFVDGKKIEGEEKLQLANIIFIGDAKFQLVDKIVDKVVNKTAPKKVEIPKTDNIKEKRRSDLLFTPRTALASGGVLEVVNYWYDSIINVEHFHPSFKNYTSVTIGDPTKAHFIGGDDDGSTHVLADVSSNGYTLHIPEGTVARLRKDGQVEEVKSGTHKMGKKDIAHVRQGELRYFFIFTRPPIVTLPKMGPKDPFLMTLMGFSLFLYVVLNILVITTVPKPKDMFQDDVWAVVHAPEKIVKPEKKIEEVKVEPPKKETPPPPPPKPVEAAPVKEPPKPIPKKVEPPKPKPKAEDLLKKNEPLPKIPPPPPEKKAAPKGAGNNSAGAQKKGIEKNDVKGVADNDVKKPSGINLGQLGLGVGKISSNTGLGAIKTNFQNAAGGGGGGAGSGLKNLGMGGIGSAKSLGVAGSSAAGQQFGQVSGGVAGDNLGKSFGGKKQSANVDLRASDPLISGGLTQQEILAVITASRNQIRHCYEKWLQTSPGSGGQLKTKFIVNTDGRVSSAEADSTTINNSQMVDCVLGVIKKLQFPQPRGNASVNVKYPFNFFEE